jgi:homoserine kinase type II
MFGLQLQPIVNAYPAACQAGRVEFLGSAGGLSGAQFWRFETAIGRLCLRRWPAEHPSRQQLSRIHRVLERAVAAGFVRLPLPLKTRDGESWVAHDGHLWQLEPWLSGDANWLAAPSIEKLRSAMNALAQFHEAVADDPLLESQWGAAPGIVRRRQQIAWWTREGVAQLGASLDGLPRERVTQAKRIIEFFQRGRARAEALLNAADISPVQLTPCIRDIWHDNVLFVGDEVSGIVDFGAMEADSVAADIARLLGSLALDDAGGWLAGLESYQTARPLTPEELRLVEAFDRANTLLSPLNWMRWLYLEQRRFDNEDRVQARIAAQVKRLEFMVGKT